MRILRDLSSRYFENTVKQNSNTSVHKDSAQQRNAAGLRRRKTVHKTAFNGESLYATSVCFVNKELLKRGTHLSAQAARSIESNIELVEKGVISSSHASHRESIQFLGDSIKHFFSNPRYAWHSFSGFLINVVGGVFFEFELPEKHFHHPTFLDQVPCRVSKDWNPN